MSDSTLNDSPLSITASVAGILTFIYAVAASALGYTYLFRSSTEDSIERFYEAFSACALESDLIRRDILRSRSTLSSPPTFAANVPEHRLHTGPRLDGVPHRLPDGRANHDTRTDTEKASLFRKAGTLAFNPAAIEESVSVGTNPYLLDPDSLGRLFEQVRTVEIELQTQAAKVIRARPRGEDSFLATVLGRGRWASRARELEASLSKREALTARLLVVQMSLMSAKMSSYFEILDKLAERVEASEIDIKSLRDKLPTTDANRQ